MSETKQKSGSREAPRTPSRRAGGAHGPLRAGASTWGSSTTVRSSSAAVLDLTGTDAGEGDEVEVLARQGENSLLAMARAAGWMVYSLMNHLSPELPRVFYRGGMPVALREPAVG